jgi:hypothetical protein
MTSARPTIELNADLEQRIEALAARCTHAPEPCPACTASAVWAVETLVQVGWYTQIRRFQSRSTPQENP